MTYKQLFIFVEGYDDVIFFEEINKLKFEQEYNQVEIIPYAKKTDVYIKNLIKNYNKANNINYIFTFDEDAINKVKKYNVDENRKTIVIKEIESWYLAGLTYEKLQSENINHKEINTDNLTKEDFDKLIPEKYRNRTDFMLEILNHFDIPTAKDNNKSFCDFADKYDLSGLKT